ncbi:hypothetical protein Esti_003599 [Eimeria stiedai]
MGTFVLGTACSRSLKLPTTSPVEEVLYCINRIFKKQFEGKCFFFNSEVASLLLIAFAFDAGSHARQTSTTTKAFSMVIVILTNKLRGCCFWTRHTDTQPFTMLGPPEFEVEKISLSTYGWRTILVTLNGEDSEPRQLKLPPKATFASFLERSSALHGLEEPAKRAFSDNGEELFDLEQVLDDDLVCISTGPAFIVRKVGGTGGAIGGYILKEVIGSGGFGTVYKGVHPETGELVAVKFINKQSFKEVDDADRVFVEIQALRDLSHKHVIKMLDVVAHPKFVCFVMEFASKGDLRGYLQAHGRLSEDRARAFFEQVLKGVHYCHSKNIVHRQVENLKLENILLDEECRCKIADFGLSHFVVGTTGMRTEAGTLAYLAPEVWSRTSQYSSPFQLDVWALGVILYALTQGRLPFAHADRLVINRLQKESLAFDSNPSPELKKIVLGMLHPDPRKRLNLSDVINAPWIKAGKPWHVRELAPQPVENKN